MSRASSSENYLLDGIPEGAGALFFTQIFSTLSFAVLYSTLVLYMTKGLHMSVPMANSIMGGFIAFNYGLHLLGGYFGGRFLSYRNLFVIGMLLQITACLTLSRETSTTLFWGLAFFLTGAGLNVTCINMMLTQLFEPNDKRREGAFLWNYSGMNLGFFIGFSLAGYFQLQENYHQLFILTSAGNALTILIVFFNWGKLKDRTTYITDAKGREYFWRLFVGIMAMIIMIPTLHWLLNHASISNRLVIIVGIFMAFLMLYFALQQKNPVARSKMLAYIILALFSLVFWSLYQLAPMGLTVFALNNVDRHVFGLNISPQWIQNVNTVVIVLGGPAMILFLKKIRARGVTFSIPLQFAFSLTLIGLGFIILPLGIYFADPQGYMNISWIIASYVLQSLGEILISPIGYAMIGQLAPQKLQGLMMGSWMMVTGIAGILSSYFSNFALSSSCSVDPLVTNRGYSHTFGLLGWSAFACGIALFILVPFMRRLIAEHINHGNENTH